MRTALRWLASVGPFAVSTAVVFAMVYGLALVFIAADRLQAQTPKFKPLPAEVRLEGVEVTCDVARGLQPVLDEELENIKLQIRVLTEGRTPILAEEPILIVLGHQWLALHNLDLHLKNFVVENGCNAV